MDIRIRPVICAVLVFVCSIAHMQFSSCYAADEPVRVLFIGNSYTAGARAGVQQFLKQSEKPFETHYITPGGRRLKQHLENDKTIAKIREGKWDYVVLQEQSQVPSLPPMKEQFLDSGKDLHAVIHKVGGKTLLYSTWGRRDGDKKNPKINPDYTTMQERLDASYSELGEILPAGVVPVGKAWTHVHKTSPDLFQKLYARDGSHPSRHGTLLIGAVFFRSLTGQKPSVPSALPKGVTQQEAKLLVQAANQ